MKLGIFTDDFYPFVGGIGRHIYDLYYTNPDHGIPSEKIKVLPNSVDTKTFHPLPHIHKIQNSILFFGNSIKRKGFDRLPKIMRNLGDKYELYSTSGLRDVKKLEKNYKLPKKHETLRQL